MKYYLQIYGVKSNIYRACGGGNSNFTTDGFPKTAEGFLILWREPVKTNCSYFPFMLMMLLPTHGEDQQTPQTISTLVMMIKEMTILMVIKSFVQG